LAHNPQGAIGGEAGAFLRGLDEEERQRRFFPNGRDRRAGADDCAQCFEWHMKVRRGLSSIWGFEKERNDEVHNRPFPHLHQFIDLI
jgi:hypothetical protein